MKKKLKRESIRLDIELYPRHDFSSNVIAQYTEAMASGAVFPPIKVDQHGRLIDGYHRLKAYDRNGVREIPVDQVEVKDDEEFYELALVANTAHGQRYTRIDYAGILLNARKLGWSDNKICKLLHITPGYLKEVTHGWFARNGSGQLVALKKSIEHMSGRTLTADQMAANKKLSGLKPTFYMNQVMLFLDNDLLDLENEQNIKGVETLAESIRQFQMKLAKMKRTKKGGTR